MKKLFVIVMMTLLSGSALAEINCYAERGDEALEIRVIDTFLARTAFIKRIHPTEKFPDEEINVMVYEKSMEVTILNNEKDFLLKINKRLSERRMPPIYSGVLTYGEIFTQIDCIMK